MPGAGLDHDLSDTDVVEVLTHGDLEIEGRLVDASNAAFLAHARLDGADVTCVYKPTAGERPLWDFPDGTLAGREVATYRLATALGWDLVPETVWRDDGPAGAGMCQRWIDVDPRATAVDVVARGDTPAGWLAVVDAYGPDGEPVTLVHADTPRLRRMTILDALANNADRKGGHVLSDTDGMPWGIDHGVTFHSEDKLRTVLWGWAGEEFDDDERGPVEQLAADLAALGIDELLTDRERRAIGQRADRLLSNGRFPTPGQEWPALPWPAF